MFIFAEIDGSLKTVKVNSNVGQIIDLEGLEIFRSDALQSSIYAISPHSSATWREFDNKLFLHYDGGEDYIGEFCDLPKTHI